jgi:hypothetical protein
MWEERCVKSRIESFGYVRKEREREREHPDLWLREKFWLRGFVKSNRRPSKSSGLSDTTIQKYPNQGCQEAVSYLELDLLPVWFCPIS